MPPDQRGLSWTEIRDFTPGIFSNLNPTNAFPGLSTVHQPSGAPPGAADENGTFRCCPSPSGGLQAVPGAQQSISVADPGELLGQPATPPAYVTGFFVRPGSTYIHYPTFPAANSDDVIIYVTECIAPGGGYAADFHYLFPIDYVDYRITNYTKTSGALVYGFFGCPYIGQDLVQGTGAFANALVPSIYIPYSNPDKADAPVNRLFIVDDVNSALKPQVVDILVNSTPASIPGMTFGHQGRIVWATEQVINSQAFGGPPTLGPPSALTLVAFVTNENFAYTDPPQSRTPINEGPLEGVIFWPENPSNYGAFVSISAGELFCVKMAGGAIYISGDLNNPNVIYYPGVQSTGKFGGKAAGTTIGAVYCSQGHGAWAWNGGNTASKISTQLRDDFYTVTTPIPFSTQYNVGPDNPTFAGFLDHFGFYVTSWGDWILFSNNWIYEVTTGSWWRLEDPDQTSFFYYGISSNSSNFYACPCAFTPSGTNVNPIIIQYSRFAPTQSYRWRSLPFRVTEDKRVQVRRIIVRGLTYSDDPSTVTLTLYDEYGDVMTTSTVAFQPDLIGPQGLIFDVGALAYTQNITIEIFATAANPANNAPDIHSISIGWRAMEQMGPTI